MKVINEELLCFKFRKYNLHFMIEKHDSWRRNVHPILGLTSCSNDAWFKKETSTQLNTICSFPKGCIPQILPMPSTIHYSGFNYWHPVDHFRFIWKFHRDCLEMVTSLMSFLACMLKNENVRAPCQTTNAFWRLCSYFESTACYGSQCGTNTCPALGMCACRFLLAFWWSVHECKPTRMWMVKW